MSTTITVNSAEIGETVERLQRELEVTLIERNNLYAELEAKTAELNRGIELGLAKHEASESRDLLARAAIAPLTMRKLGFVTAGEKLSDIAIESIAKDAYRIADACMKERSK